MSLSFKRNDFKPALYLCKFSSFRYIRRVIHIKVHDTEKCYPDLSLVSSLQLSIIKTLPCNHEANAMMFIRLTLRWCVAGIVGVWLVMLFIFT